MRLVVLTYRLTKIKGVLVSVGVCALTNLFAAPAVTLMAATALNLLGSGAAQAGPTPCFNGSGTISTALGAQEWVAPPANCTITSTGSVTVNDSQTHGTLMALTASQSSSTLTNSGIIQSNLTASAPSSAVAEGLNNIGTVVSISNSGLISSNYAGTLTGSSAGFAAGALADTTEEGSVGTIGTLSNSGVISAGVTGSINSSLMAFGTLYGVAVAGTHSGAGANATIGTLINSGNISAAANGAVGPAAPWEEAFGIHNAGFIGTLTNAAGGLIAADSTGILDQGTIGTLTNSGTIDGGVAGLLVSGGGTIGNLQNMGTISGLVSRTLAGAGLVIFGSVGTLTNVGIISGATALEVGGSIGVLNNQGTIRGGSESGIYNGGQIGTLVNSGLITSTGAASALLNDGGTIGVLTNHGIITAPGNAVANSGLIGSFDNVADGSIAGSIGVVNSGTILSLSNEGTISGTATAIVNQGYIGTLTNSGSIDAPVAAIKNSGAIGTVLNSGVIGSTSTYAAFNNAGSIASMQNLAGGSILSRTTAVLNAAGATIGSLSNAGVIDGQLTGIVNFGSIGTLTNSGTITGAQGLTVDQSGTVSQIINTGQMLSSTTGGIAANIDGNVGTFTNSGTLSMSGNTFGAAALGTAGDATIGQLINSGLISATGAPVPAINNGGVIGTLTNSAGGIISASGYTALFNPGDIGTLSNAGTISAGGTAISNRGTIDSIINASGGTISGTTGNGIDNSGSLGALSNAGLIDGGADGLINAGTIGTLSNTGTISDKLRAGIYNGGTILALDNGGLISGVDGIANTGGGSIGTLGNTGTILATGDYGLYDKGAIDGLNNGGVIQGPQRGVFIDVGGSLGTLSNSGAISAPTAVYVAAGGSIGAVTNSGTIAGKFDDLSGTDLSIAGASGSAYGVLTGASGGLGTADVGTLQNSGANLLFASGNILLNDNIDLGGTGTVTNGAMLQVNNPISINGNFHQTAGGSLLVGVTGLNTYGGLDVSGTATIDPDGHVALTRLGGFTFTTGDTFTLVEASDATYNVDGMTAGVAGYNGTVVISQVQSGAQTDLVVCLGSASSCAGQDSGGSGATTGANQYSLATTSNAMAANDALGRYSGSNPQMIALSNAVVALGTSGAANHAGDQLIADGHGAATQLALEPVMDVMNVVNAHADETRLAQAGGGTSSGISAGENGLGWATWSEAVGGFAHQSQDNQFAGYGLTSEGYLVGADHAVGDSMRAGLIGGYTHANLDDHGDRTGDLMALNGYDIFGYGSYLGSRMYVDATAGVMLDHFITARVVDFSGFSGAAYGTHDGTQTLFEVDGGIPLSLQAPAQDNGGGRTLTPLWGVIYGHLNQDGYRESGSAAALAVAGNGISTLKSELGFKLEQGLPAGNVVWVPDVKALWRHEFDQTQTLQSASFVEDETGSTGFMTQGPRPPIDSALLEAGVTMLSGQSVSLALKYDVEIAGGYVDQSGRLRVRWEF